MEPKPSSSIPEAPTIDWRDSADRKGMPRASVADRVLRPGPLMKPVLRLAAVVAALAGLASFLMLTPNAPRGTPIPESSLHVAALLAAQNRPAVTRNAQASPPMRIHPGEIRAAEPQAPRPHLPIVRAREGASLGASAGSNRSAQPESRGLLIVQSEDRPLELREAPDDDAVAVASSMAGTLLTVLETVSGWHRVLGPDGRWGWVRAADVTQAGPGPAGPKTRRIEVRADRLPSSSQP